MFGVAVRRSIRAQLERPIGVLGPEYRHCTLYDRLGPQLGAVLRGHNIPVSDSSRLTGREPGKWKFCDDTRAYVLRNTPEGLALAQLVHPAISSAVELLDSALRFLRWTLPAKARRLRWLVLTLAHKRLVDRPTRRLVNVGAGWWYCRQWRNLDYVGEWYVSHRMLIDFRHDLSRLTHMPFDDESVDLFYSEHVFEHLTDECCQHAFTELCRSLAPSGGVRVVVPDADLICEKLDAGEAAFFGSLMHGRPASLAEAFLILIAHPRDAPDERRFYEDFRSLPRVEFLDQCKATLHYDYMRAGEHINWFNFDKLRRMLLAAGFTKVERSAPQVSRFPEIRGRQFDTRPSYSLHIDATKA